MSATAAGQPDPALPAVPSPRDPLGGLARVLVRLVPLLQAVLTVAAFVAVAVALALGVQDLALPLYLLVIGTLGAFGLAAALSTAWTYQRRSRGRVLAIIVDYLAFLTAFLLLLHLLEVFTGVGDLADVFAAALPWMALALVAFLLGYALEALSHRAAITRTIGLLRTGLYVVAAAGVVLAIDAPSSALDLLRKLGDPLNLGLALVSLVLLGFLLAMWGPEGRQRYGSTLRDSELLDGMLLISPNFLGFLGFFAGPLLFSLYVSLTDWDAFSDPILVGLDNYLELLSLQVLWLEDPSVLVPAELQQGFAEIARIGPLLVAAKDKLFWLSLRNIFFFSVIAIPLAVIPALFIASLLNSRVRGIRIFRTIYFIPTVAGVVGIAIIWKQLLDQTVGWVNYFITLGVDFLNSTFGLALVDPKIGWLSDPATAMPVIAVVFAWTTVGFNSVLFLAGLQGIPGDLYEAATIDGANRWQRFINITVPSVSATTFFVVATTTILAFQLFTEVWVLTSPNPGGPNNATLTPTMYLYNSGFKNFEFGYASAVAWVLFGIIFVFTIVQFRRQRAEAQGA